jgi:dipeptidyl aminopeptidase/acylaminoacyl peptidase
MGYLAWHPSGRLIAYSANKLSQFYHTRGETRDVFDARSDLGVYHLDSNTFSNPVPIAQTNRSETWPAWSPDGRYLYFSSAAPLPVEEFRQVRYDLMRVAYDLANDRWDQPELLLAASASGGSATQPRVSPDGRYLLFCISRYGNFPVYQASSDLYVMELATGGIARPNINSERTDSWHCWSSNSRWVVFSSKRLDGLFSRPFFSYVDSQGNFHKPFLLPQADPEFYESFLKNFNVPELVNGPITVSERALAETINHPARRIVPSRAASATQQSSTPSESAEHALYPRQR